MMGFEDDILIGYVIEYLASGGGTEDANVTRSTATKGELRKVFVSGPDMYTYLLPFLDSHTETFMTELWELLRAAEASPIGIPPSMMASEAAKSAARRAELLRRSALVASAISNPSASGPETEEVITAEDVKPVEPRVIAPPSSRTAPQPVITGVIGDSGPSDALAKAKAIAAALSEKMAQKRVETAKRAASEADITSTGKPDDGFIALGDAPKIKPEDNEPAWKRARS